MFHTAKVFQVARLVPVESTAPLLTGNEKKDQQQSYAGTRPASHTGGPNPPTSGRMGGTQSAMRVHLQ